MPHITYIDAAGHSATHNLPEGWNLMLGAINNGVEFMEEMGDDPEQRKEAVSLISYSASAASAKLMAFRIAYGAGGRDNNIKPEVAELQHATWLIPTCWATNFSNANTFGPEVIHPLLSASSTSARTSSSI